MSDSGIVNNRTWLFETFILLYLLRFIHFFYKVFVKVKNRISRVVTRSGDQGQTGLADGSRVSKDSARIDAIGQVDELNSVIGLVISEGLPEKMRQELQAIQNELFNIGGELAVVKTSLITEEKLVVVEKLAEEYNQELPPLRDFILPGGTKTAALCHLARSVCRRAERAVVALGKQENISPVLYQYLNRLSDLLFIVARVANKMANESDIFWKK